jgi:tight adherence protein B
MLVIIAIIFFGVFAVTALVMYAFGSVAAHEAKRVLATLDTALSNQTKQEVPDLVLDFRKKELLSAVPWMNRILRKNELAPKLYSLLSQANLKWTAGNLMAMSAGCFLVPAVLVHWRTGSMVLSLLIGLIFSFAPFGYVMMQRKKRFNKFIEGLPEALEMMVSALRVGHSLNASMGLVTRECADPIGSEFKICFDEQNYGLELRTAMDNMISRVPVQDLRIISTAILIQKESGGNLAEVLDKTAHVIRERFRLKRQVGVHTAQGRLTGWILSFLPVVLGVALYFVNPDTMSLLWHREIGIKLLYISGTMTVIGSLIIRHIVNMEV